MPHRLIETPEYQWARASLGSNARVALRYVEAGIQLDPRVTDQTRYQYGAGLAHVIVDRSADDLLVAYRIVGDDAVELLEVMDARQPPPWYVP